MLIFSYPNHCPYFTQLKAHSGERCEILSAALDWDQKSGYLVRFEDGFEGLVFKSELSYCHEEGP